MIDFVATHPHYWDHLEPIALELEARGHRVRAWRNPDEKLPVDRALAVVSSFGDYQRAFAAQRKIVFMEHGAGQQYLKPHSSYAGSPHRQGVVAFLAPGPHVIQANSKRFSHVPQVAVGVPKLDRWHTQPPKSRQGKPVVVISFHWNCKVDEESRSAFPHYRHKLVDLLGRGEYEIRAHCHPRARARAEMCPVFASLGIPFIDTFTEVMDTADLYVCDNSSTIYEFASTGRPVVLLNAPWYRREIEIGLRFWREASVGLQCDHPDDLHQTILRALSDPPEQRRAREASIRRVYSYTDGSATKRAADAIEEVIMASTDIREKGVVVRALRNVSGHYGIVGPGWTLEVTKDTIYITNARGEERKPVALSSPFSDASLRQYVAELTMDRGRATRFELVSDAKQAPKPEEDKKAPAPSENKLAPNPEEDKSVELSALDQDIISLLKAGEGKSAIVRELRQREEYTEAQVKDGFDDLLDRGIVTKSGPDNRPVYEVLA